MTVQLVQKIKDSITTGAALVTYQDIINAFPTTNPAKVDVVKAISAVEQVAGLIQGGSISAVVPPTLLPAGLLSVQSVTFTLDLEKKTITEIDCAIAFGQDGKGVPWKIATVGTAALTASLITLVMKWVTSGDSAGITASGTGSASLGDLNLALAVAYPQPTITCSQGAAVNVGDFFGQLGLTDVGFLDDMLLENFKLSYSFAKSQTSLSLNAVGTSGSGGVTLIPNVLAFEKMTFALNSGGKSTTASIGGLLLLSGPAGGKGQLVLDTKADRAASGGWKFSGQIDLAATWQTLHQGTPPKAPPVTAADLATIFGAGSGVPDVISGLSIAALSIDYTYPASKPKDDNSKDGSGTLYTVKGVFDLNWSIADLQAQLSVTLSNVKNTANVLSSTFEIQGVTFQVSYTFGNDPSTFDVAINAPKLSLTGTYAPKNPSAAGLGEQGGGIITLNFVTVPSLADFIAWFVGEVTGNRSYALPDPWDDVLARATLQGVALKINLGAAGKKSTITCTIPVGLNLLAVELVSFGVTYDPSNQSGRKSSGLSFQTTLKFPGGTTAAASTKTYDWDPATQQPPTIPGSTAALLDIKLLAAGQHIGFPVPPPQTVEDALDRVGKALDPSNWSNGLYPTDPKIGLTFSSDIGWLIGTSVTLLGQVDIKFIFNDPTIYGLSLVVNDASGSSSSATNVLNEIAGLSAEIVYRKISDTVGVYEGTLTLPEKIRKIDLNQVVITLPQFSLSIYTNGDFSFDAGFPYNRDFSQSLSVVATEYAGAGGFYYAKLDGLDPAELPHINPSKGIFSPVTEIGIGFQIGVSKSFSSGPLSASASVMLLGIFQGVFAKYTQYSDGATDEFYSVDATLGVVGHLSGEINFVIITASLDVTVSFEVDLTLVAHKQSVATVTVSVDVELTVSINCGLFTIHIHCGYSTTFSTQATFGGDSSALWDSALVAPARMMFGAAADPPPFSVGWQPISDTNPLTLYFIPQLTAGALYPPSGQQTAWYYVGQLGLSNPTTDGRGNITSVNTDPSYANFVRGLLVWALNAINNTANPTPILCSLAEAKTITAQNVSDLNDALADMTGAAWQSIDIQAQFNSAFQINAVAMVVPDGKTAADYGIGFFPAVPGMTVTVVPEGQQPIRLEPAMLSPAQLRQARTGTSAQAPRTTFLAQLRTQAGVASTTVQPSPTLVLTDFVVLAIRSGLGKIIEKKLKIFPNGDDQAVAIRDILAGVQPDLASISGMTTRFMLHGARWPVDGVYKPLYALLAQQVALNSAALGAANLTMTLDFAQGAAWGISFPNGATSLSLSSSAANPAVFKPKTQIPTTPQFVPSAVSVAPMGVADKSPVRFALKNGIIDVPDQTTLWQLPQALADYLAQPNANATFLVQKQQQPKAGEPPPPPPVNIAATFVFTLDFRVRKIPNADNTYELFDVDQGGLQSLQTLVTANTELVSGLALAYAQASTPDGGNRQAVVTPIDFTSNTTFIVQSNFSTETKPPPSLLAAPAAGPDLIKLFMTKLWTAGITNSGGYFLFDVKGNQPGLPDTLFDASGLATVTLVATLLKSDGTTPIALPAYVTAAQIPSGEFSSSDDLFISSDAQDLRVAHPLLPPGHIGITLSCAVPPAPPTPTGGAGDYGNALDHLYNLITAEGVTVGGKPVPYQGVPPVFSPGKDSDDKTWRYSHVFPLVANWPALVKDWPTDAVPPSEYNPYNNANGAIGQTVDFDLRWTDIFGNEWPKVGGGTDPVIAPLPTLQYTDPLIALSQLPYLTLDYAVGPAPQLVIEFAFTAPSYDTGDDMADDNPDAKRKRADLMTYAQAYYQLADITATLTSSLLVDSSGQPKPIAVNVGIIRNNIQAIYAYLLSCPVGAAPPTTVPPLASITIPVPAVSAMPSGGVEINGALKFALTVALTLTRNGPVAKDFANTSVQTVSTTIAPQTAQQGSDAHSLVPFATNFETALEPQDLAIAVGPTDGEGLTANSRQVWVVRYGGTSGITINFQTDAPKNFAPRPLSNQLQSPGPVTVHQVDPTTGKFAADTKSVVVTDVDLDAQMQKFLSAVDLMFSATDAIPMALINPDAIDSLAKSKQAIVGSLVECVTDLQTGQSYGSGSFTNNDPIGAAADRYRQECLIRLSAFYDMDAVTVPTVSATFGSAGDPGLYLFGHLNVTDLDAKDVETEFSLTSGKCALATKPTPIAIGLFAKNVSAFSKYACNASFAIDAIQHDVTPVPVGDATYDVGNWLTFVRPRPDLTIKAGLAVPIALRAFPQPPQLLAQTANALLADPYVPPSDNHANAQILWAKTWSLNGSYQHSYAAQDTVHLKVEINIHPANALAVAAADDGQLLIEALVDFNVNYAQLQSVFAANRLDTIRTPDAAKGATTLSNALSSFATLVDAVATSNWPALAPQLVARLAGVGALEAQESQYLIRDGYGVTSPDDRWHCKVKWEKDLQTPIGFVPQLRIDGWKTVLDPPSQSGNALIYAFVDPNDGSKYLCAQKAQQIQGRTVVAMPPYEFVGQPAFTPLDIIDRQNGLLSMMIGRNEGLPPPFQYQTPWVTYTEVISPTLDTFVAIDIAGIGQPNGQPAPRSLVDHLTALFTAVMKISGNINPVTANFQTTLYFAYPLNTPPQGAEPLALVQLPIALRLPTEIDGPVSGTPQYAKDMAKLVTDWLTANGLSATQRQQLWLRSELRLDVSLFSDFSATGQPILRLRDLFVECKYIV
jgi:hypothetical protein